VIDVACWPFAAPNNVRSHVGYWGLSGLVVLIESFVESDPLQQFSRIICRGAQSRTKHGPTRAALFSFTDPCRALEGFCVGARQFVDDMREALKAHGRRFHAAEVEFSTPTIFLWHIGV
jgi:hypothetical protein